MRAHLLDKLRARTVAIQTRWETLLHIEPVSGPLGNPDAMARLIPETLREILAAISATPRQVTLQQAAANRLPACECGHNPYLSYFVAGEQALVEAFVLLQSEMPASERHESDLAELIQVIRHLGHGEIDTFCGICAHRCVDPKCRHRALATA